MKSIIVLGASGSIGLQSIDVIAAHPDQFQLAGMAVGHNIEMLEQILNMITCPFINVSSAHDAAYLKECYPDITFTSGQEGLLSLCAMPADMVINGISGFAGVAPSLKVLETGKYLALANKETMVVAGPLVKAVARPGQIIPVDSEHSAIFQCLRGENMSDVARLIITASGGPFRDKTPAELEHVTKEDALKHPNWSMGPMITVDSATMFNKALEIIEAHWLFDMPYEKIDVIMHPESIVHSMVEFVDKGVMAQLGMPDMRMPIQYALTYPDRMPLRGGCPLRLEKLGSLTFRAMDQKRFKAIKIAYEVGAAEKTYPAVLNAAKEAATKLFLNDKIAFLDIEKLVIAALKAHEPKSDPDYEDLRLADQWARSYVEGVELCRSSSIS